MLSSVRRGLADARDAAAPVIEILGYECVRFEGVTTEPVPPRAVCVDMVTRSDVYLLLLGDLYGEPMPDTDLAPTEEEWTVARRLGKPAVAFVREGIAPEPRQAEFISRVQSYQVGVWRDTFHDVPDLLRRLGPALADAAGHLRGPVSQPLARSVAVPWRATDDRRGLSARAVLETYVLPLDAMDAIRATSLPDVEQRMARAGQDHGLFSVGEALRLGSSVDGAFAEVPTGGRRLSAGVATTRERVVAVWEELPGEMGSLVDAGAWRDQVARSLRLAMGLGLVEGGAVTAALRLLGVDHLRVAAGPNSVTLPFLGRSDPVVVEPSRLFPSDRVAGSSTEIAHELIAELMLRLPTR